LLPWRPRFRGIGADKVGDVSGVDFGDDLGIGLVFVLFIVFLPVSLALLLFSAELLVVLALVPFLMSGQLLGLLPWQLGLRDVDGRKHYVSVTGTRKMLEARRYYRSLRV
jgi:hypothetical protein